MKKMLIMCTVAIISNVLHAQSSKAVQVSNSKVLLSPSKIERVVTLFKTKNTDFSLSKETINLVELNSGDNEINTRSIDLGINISTEFGQLDLNFIINAGYTKVVSLKKSKNGFTLVTKQYRSISEDRDTTVTLTQVVDYSESLEKLRACVMSDQCDQSGSIKIQESWVIDSDK